LDGDHPDGERDISAVLSAACSALPTNHAVAMQGHLDVWYHRWYYRYVNKTTVYLPDELKRAVTRTARGRGISEAAVIREAIADAVSRGGAALRGPVFASDVLMADDVDPHLAGFGE